MALWENDRRSIEKQWCNEAQELLGFLLSRVSKDGFHNPSTKVLVAIQELAALSKITGPDCSKTVIAMKNDNQTKITDFEKTYVHRKKLKTKTIAPIDWHIYWPLNVVLNHDMPKKLEISVLGQKFFIIREGTVKQRFGSKNLETLLENLRYQVIKPITSDIYVRTCVRANSSGEAWRTVADKFDVLRALFEFSFGAYGKWRRSVYESPRCDIHPSNFALARSGKGEMDAIPFFSNIKEKPKAFVFKKEHWSPLKLNEKWIRFPAPKNSTLELLCTCLTLYSQALDEIYTHHCFLGFWQILETLSFAEEFGGKTRDLCKRLKRSGSDMGFIGTGFYNTLLRYAGTRNDLVHRGLNQNIEQEDVDHLKYICECFLDWLINISRFLPTQDHIKQYYRHRNLSEIQLSTIKDVVAKV